MQIFTHVLGGREVTIYFPESTRDMHGFDDFLARGDKVLGLDTETTGLNVYTPLFRVRLVQFGNADTAWVLRSDLFADQIRRALRQDRHFVVHNAAFDLQVIDRTLGVTIEELGPRVFDTRIFAHLLDPRQRHEGGAGLRLKELSSIYVDPSAPDTEEGLSSVFSSLFSAWKKTVSEDEIEDWKRRYPKRTHMAFGFTNIEIAHPLYVRYAGLDPILARRLFDELAPMVRDLGLNHLSQFEHHLQTLLAIMQRKGIREDVQYIEGTLIPELETEAEKYRKVAARYGVENVNSTSQVADALAGMGEILVERTPSGALKVDKNVLMPFADLDREWERLEARKPNPLADAVLRAKRAEKWRASYAQAFLDLRDTDDRLHASIGGLQARTARMSVSSPPLQQLPSGDWKIRRALVADPGMTIIAADYTSVEMRVLAALADVSKMKEAIAAGRDLNDFTAEIVYGPDFTKFQRGLMKGVGYGKVYGGGATTLSRQTGADIEAVRRAIGEYDETYPEIKRFGKRLQSRAEYGKKEVITPAGRHLPLDRDRLYAATNYMVQSTARDLLAQAIVDIFDAGMGDYLLLPVHDELVAQAPTAEAADVIHEIGRLMESDFMGVPIVSDPEVYGPTWGHGYGAPF